MSDGRLPTGLLVSALMKRVNDAGGFAVVRAKGDADAGAVLVLATDRGDTRILERGFGPDGRIVLIESRPADSDEGIEDYWRRRRRRDPDLWVVELDSPDSERFIAETILAD